MRAGAIALGPLCSLAESPVNLLRSTKVRKVCCGSSCWDYYVALANIGKPHLFSPLFLRFMLHLLGFFSPAYIALLWASLTFPLMTSVALPRRHREGLEGD